MIEEMIPNGSVIPAHTEKGHFYDVGERHLPSVTGKLQLLKDESIQNWKMNRAVEHVRQNWKDFTDQNIDAHLTKATEASGVILEDAGDIGRLIHDCRERYYKEWMKTDLRPDKATDFVPKDQYDVRAVSSMRALEQFVTDWNYVPVVTELLVYDLESSVAGTLDDIGLMDKVVWKGSSDCGHGVMVAGHCMTCDRKVERELVLCDLKSSNAFKDHYFYQVAMYYMMFKKLTGLKPTRCFILKVSKEDGTYKIEDLKNLGMLVRFSKNLLKVSQGLELIKSQRKDNQKKVITL